jgi:hypothetical protein
MGEVDLKKEDKPNNEVATKEREDLLSIAARIWPFCWGVDLGLFGTSTSSP